ncbi:MAG: DNA polymerase III subunit beta [Patescibacteria group bacterium]
MKVSFLCENVNKKISIVNHAVSSRSQLPILLNFLFKAEKGKFTISATDLEIGIEAIIPASIEEEGSITVPAKTFYDLLSSIDKGKVILKTEENNLIFEGNKIRTIFQTIKADEFPKIYEEKGDEIGVFTKEVLEKEIPGVVFSASQDSGRPALSGVLFGRTKNLPAGRQGKKGEFYMVATDGYRLSLKKGGVGDGDEDKILVPSRILRELAQLKDGGSVSVRVSPKSNQIIFEQEDIVLVGRLIEAEFPNYQKIIPQDYSTKAVIDRKDFLSAVKTCAVFARETANIIKLSIQKNKVVVSASAPSVGETTIEVDAVMEGEENEIAFNVRYVLEFLSNTDGEKIIFEMSGPLNSGVFKIEGEPNYLHIIMPIRVQG